MVASSKTSNHSFDIAESSKKVGQLTPILKDKFGNIIDGNHRLAIDPNWKSITDESIDTDEKNILATFHLNYHRRTMSDVEIKQKLNSLLRLYLHTLDSGQPVQKIVLQGRQRNELLHRAAEAFGVSYKTISRYAEPEFKQKTPVKKTQSSEELSSTQKPSKRETSNISIMANSCLCSQCNNFKRCNIRNPKR